MEESEKHSGLVVEFAMKSKFLEKELRDNGHDCWGNLEWTTWYHVTVNREKRHVNEKSYVIHDGKNVVAVCSDDWWLKYELEKIAKAKEQEFLLEQAKREMAEAEERYKKLSYPEQLKFRIEGIRKKHPYLEKVFEKVREVCSKDSRNYDYEIERTFEMYNEVSKILEKA